MPKDHQMDPSLPKEEHHVHVFYDIHHRFEGGRNLEQLNEMPNGDFACQESTTFRDLLYRVSAHWRISSGAIESKSILLVNKECKVWPSHGRVLHFLKSKLNDSMRGVILRYSKRSADGAELSLTQTSIKHRIARSLRSSTHRHHKHGGQRGDDVADHTIILWRIYAYYCVTGDPNELCLRCRSFVKFGQDCGLYRRRFSKEMMAVVFDHSKTISNAHMSFDQFLNALVEISTNYLYCNIKAPEEAFGLLLVNDVLPNAKLFPYGPEDPACIARQAHIDSVEVQDIFRHLRSSLSKIYAHYARPDFAFHHGSFKTLPMSLTGFRRFSREVGIVDIGIGAQDLAHIFITSAAGYLTMDDESRNTTETVGKHALTYDTFLVAIGHTALIAFPRMYNIPNLENTDAEFDEIGPRIMKSFFQHMSWCISKTAPSKRPEGGNTLVRSCLVLFEQRSSGNPDHLHMYEKRHEPVHHSEAHSNLHSDRPMVLECGDIEVSSDEYVARQSIRRLEEKRVFFGGLRGADKQHSNSGRQRIYNILNRAKEERKIASLALPKQEQVVTDSPKVNARRPIGSVTSKFTTKTVPRDPPPGVSPALSVRFGTMAFAEALDAERRLCLESEGTVKDVEALYAEGDSYFLAGIMHIQGAGDRETEEIEDKASEIARIYSLECEPLDVKLRIALPKVVTKQSSRSILKMWANAIVSNAKKRLLCINMDCDNPRLSNMLPSTPFVCSTEAAVEALKRSLEDITLARKLYAMSMNVVNGEYDHGVLVPSPPDYFDHGCALSLEACILYVLSELKPEASVQSADSRMFHLLWNACMLFAKASQRTNISKSTSEAYANNWAISLFRLGTVDWDFPHELGPDIGIGLPLSMNKQAKEANASQKSIVLAGALALLENIPGIATAAIEMVQHEIKNIEPLLLTSSIEGILSSVIGAEDEVAKRSKNRRVSRKRSIVEWSNRAGTPVTPMLRRDSRSMSAVDIPKEEEEELLWTSRFADYFTVVGRGKLLTQSPFPESPGELEFTSKLLDQFPKPPGLPDMEVPTQLPDFCFPNGVKLSETPSPPRFFHFVLTDFSGTALYVTCITFYDRMDTIDVVNLFRGENKGSGKNQFPTWVNLQDMDSNPTLYSPKSVCILSHWAFFNVFKKFLAQLYRIYKNETPIPLERYVMNFMFDVPLPPCGDTRVQYTLADETVFISRPEPNELPLLDISMKPLFECLSLENIVTIVGDLLCERSIVLCSKRLSLLTIAGEALRALIFPFSWQAIYVPVLPRSKNTIEFLNSPVPFFMGMCFDLEVEHELVSEVENVVFVDIDRDRIYDADDGYFPRLPELHRKSLMAKLKKVVGPIYRPDASFNELRDCLFYDQAKTISENKRLVEKGKPLDREHFALLGGHKILNSRLNRTDRSKRRTMSIDEQSGFSDIPIRDAFLRLFVHLLANYRKFMRKDLDETISSPRNSVEFDKVSFINENKSSREFLGSLVETQMFAKFISDRCDSSTDSNEIRFFDESIIEKGPRSGSLTFGRTITKATPLLDDKSHNIKDTYVVPAANTLGLETVERIQYDSFPETLQVENFGPARTETFLVETSPKVVSSSLSIRRIYIHRSATSPVETRLVDHRQSFRQVISFVGILVDHIILLSIAEVRRKKLEEQELVVKQLRKHILKTASPAFNTAPKDSLTLSVNMMSTINISSPTSDVEDREQNCSPPISSPGAGTIPFVAVDHADDIRGRRAPSKFPMVLLVKHIRSCIFSSLETAEFNFLTRVCTTMRKAVRGEKLLWQKSVRVNSLPRSLRGRFWIHFAGIQTLVKKSEKNFYFDLLDKAHSSKVMKLLESINFDVQHIEALLESSFPTEESESSFRAADFKSRLRNILYAYATFDPDLGYCDGMSQLASFILWWLKDIHISTSEVEQRVFWMLVVLLRHFGLESLYASGLACVTAGNSRFQINPTMLLMKYERLLKSKLPSLKNHFDAERVDFRTIYLRWFRTMFTEFDLVPPTTVARFWDIFFIEGWESVMKASIAILSLLEGDLLRLPLEGILLYLRTIEQHRPDVFHIDPTFLLSMSLCQ